MAAELVSVEESLIDDLFGICGGGLTLAENVVSKEEVKSYVRSVANKALQGVGVEAIWKGEGEGVLGWVGEIMEKETRKDEFESGNLFGNGGAGGGKQQGSAAPMASEDFTLDADF